LSRIAQHAQILDLGFNNVAVFVKNWRLAKDPTPSVVLVAIMSPGSRVALAEM
jgi:hypothetical protein